MRWARWPWGVWMKQNEQFFTNQNQWYALSEKKHEEGGWVISAIDAKAWLDKLSVQLVDLGLGAEEKRQAAEQLENFKASVEALGLLRKIEIKSHQAQAWHVGSAVVHGYQKWEIIQKALVQALDQLDSMGPETSLNGESLTQIGVQLETLIDCIKKLRQLALINTSYGLWDQSGEKLKYNEYKKYIKTPLGYQIKLKTECKEKQGCIEKLMETLLAGQSSEELSTVAQDFHLDMGQFIHDMFIRMHWIYEQVPASEDKLKALQGEVKNQLNSVAMALLNHWQHRAISGKSSQWQGYQGAIKKQCHKITTEKACAWYAVNNLVTELISAGLTFDQEDNAFVKKQLGVFVNVEQLYRSWQKEVLEQAWQYSKEKTLKVHEWLGQIKAKVQLQQSNEGCGMASALIKKINEYQHISEQVEALKVIEAFKAKLIEQMPSLAMVYENGQRDPLTNQAYQVKVYKLHKLQCHKTPKGQEPEKIRRLTHQQKALLAYCQLAAISEDWDKAKKNRWHQALMENPWYQQWCLVLDSAARKKSLNELAVYLNGFSKINLDDDFDNQMLNSVAYAVVGTEGFLSIKNQGVLLNETRLFACEKQAEAFLKQQGSGLVVQVALNVKQVIQEQSVKGLAKRVQSQLQYQTLKQISDENKSSGKSYKKDFQGL